MDQKLAEEKSLQNQKYFESLSYWEQWDEIARDVMKNGNSKELSPMIVHLVWHCILFGFLILVNNFAGGGQLEGVDYWSLFAKNIIVFFYITATLGINGTYNGPLVGEPLMRNSAYRFMTGTLKEPMFKFLGNKRGIFDVILVVYTLVVSIMMLVLPNPPSILVIAYAIAPLAMLLIDHGGHVGSDGHYHLPLAIILIFRYCVNLGWLAAMQLFLLSLYVCSGLGKFGPWFSCFVALEWTMPPCVSGNSFIAKLFYKDAANSDFSIRSFVTWLSLIVSFSECVLPVLVLLTPDVLHKWGFASLHMYPVYIGVAFPLCVHAYVVLHLPLTDATAQNVLLGFLWFYSNLIMSTGFAYDSFTEIPPVFGLFLGGLITFFAVGHVRTGFNTECYRHSSGNWCQGFYLINAAGEEKLKNNVTAPGHGIWLESLVKREMMHPWEARMNGYRMMAAMWFGHLNCRVMPKIMEKYGLRENKLTDVRWVVHCMPLNQWCCGLMGPSALRSKGVIKSLQDVCKFEEDEFVYCHTDSFTTFPNTCKDWPTYSSTWRVEDAKKGVIASGKMTHRECVKFTKPSKAMAFDATSDLNIMAKPLL